MRLAAFRETVWTLRNAVNETFFSICSDLFFQQMLYMNLFLYLCGKKTTLHLFVPVRKVYIFSLSLTKCTCSIIISRIFVLKVVRVVKGPDRVHIITGILVQQMKTKRERFCWQAGQLANHFKLTFTASNERLHPASRLSWLVTFFKVKGQSELTVEEDEEDIKLVRN